MLLDDLVISIQTVQTRIREHATSFSQNEYRTRICLIDPLLHALGWDVSDPKSVTLEHQLGNRRVDYALLGEDGKPRVFIEAKHLGENLESEEFQDQVFNYAWRQKLKFVGLTDGNRWIIEDLQARLNDDDSRILDITVSTESPDVCAQRFLLRANNILLFKQVCVPREGLSPNVIQSELATSSTESISPEFISHIREGFPSLANFETLGKGRHHISRMYIPDRGEIQLSGPSQFMVETAEWLIRMARLEPGICPIFNGRYLVIHTVYRSLYGSPSPHRLSNGLYLYKTHWHLATMLSNSKFLVERCGMDPDHILLKSA